MDSAQLDFARNALLAFAKASHVGSEALAASAAQFDPIAVIPALHGLDDAGALEEVYHADWDGKRDWRVRCMTTAGQEIARLISDETIWAKLKNDASLNGELFPRLVKSYTENISLA